MSWRSSDSLKAVVSAAGLVTGIAAGTAYVIATADGKSDTAVVTVAAPSCEVASSTWLNKPFTRQTGSFTAEYDATPSGSGVDGVTGLAPAAAADYPDLAAIVRFSPSGTIDARNGSVYAALKPIPYTAGARYRVRLAVNVPARTYSAFVTPPGGAEEVIGNGLAFRTEQANATDLEDWSARTSAGTLSLCGFTLSGAAAPAPVASVGVSPASASLAVGDTVRLVATPRDADGNALTGRSVTWTTSGAAVATVSSTGLVTGMGAGTATISATSEGRTGVATVTVTTSATTRPGFHVSPAGSSANDGSASRPWSLTYALSGAGGRIQPGDTVWLRNGTYAGSFRTSISGTQSQPIVFRQYPGERATIDGGLRAEGADLVFWGFEIMQSNPTGNGELPGLLIYTLRGKFINLVVHDAAQQGITFWDGADDAEVYGSIVYNNGLEENKDHGIYVHNSTGTKLIQDNVFFNNLAYGIHAYAGPDDDYQRNIHVIGNASFNNGAISSQWTGRANLLIGAEVWGSGMKALDNMLYFSGSEGWNLMAGYTAPSGTIEVRGNMAWGGGTGLVVSDWESATVQNNTVGGAAQVVELTDPVPLDQEWSGNRYYQSATAESWVLGGDALTLSAWRTATGLASSDVAQSGTPTAPQIFVRPNRYEAGRAHVVVYNWTRQSQVSVGLSNVLTAGQRYEVRNVQNPYGPPVAQGTYTGAAVSLPMSGVAPPAPIGRSTRPPPRTGPLFDVFLVTVTP
jgi:parallel beta-helix repeat protein